MKILKSLKKITALLIVLIFNLNGISYAFAFENSTDFNNTVEIPIMTGYNFDEYIDFNSEAVSDVTMTDVKINISDKITISGALNYEEEVYSVDFDGDVYPFDNGIHKNNLVLGEFNSSSNRFKVINFKCFGSTRNEYLLYNNKVMENKSSISLALEDINNGKKLYLQCEIENTLFDELLTVANESLSSLNMEEDSKVNKLLTLYQFSKAETASSKNIANNSSKEDVVEGPVIKDSKDGYPAIYGAPALSYTTMKRFVDALNAYGSVKLADYGIPTSFFTTTGWGHYHSKSPDVYSYSNYSSKNGAYQYLAQFALLQGVANSSTTGSEVSYGLQLSLYDGMIVEYDTALGTVKVLFYGLPLTLSNVQLGISKLAGNYNNIFIERDVNGSMNNKNYSAIKGLIGLALSNQYMSTFWDFATIEIQSDAIYGYKSIFRNTVNGQITYYGKLIRAIYADTSSAFMNSAGHYFLLDGKFIFNSTWTVEWNYKYTATHNL